MAGSSWISGHLTAGESTSSASYFAHFSGSSNWASGTADGSLLLIDMAAVPAAIGF